jgi:hypothetical protein
MSAERGLLHRNQTSARAAHLVSRDASIERRGSRASDFHIGAPEDENVRARMWWW